MAKIVFVEHDGTTHEVEADAGLSVMEAATNNGVPGIDADCGGMCACATCHCYVNGEWAAKAGTRSEDEAEMLDITEHVTEHSRLACQIEISDELDGLTVSLPESQH